MLVSKDNRFVVGLMYAFQDDHNYFIVMENAAGGCFSNLIYANELQPREQLFYVAEIALGLNGLHKNMIIHRDLKPDNILVMESGHLKISDLGASASMQMRIYCNVVCGTYKYCVSF